MVVDDLDMKITHVVRGDDHVNNTPRQINIIRALDAEPPIYAHVPTVLGEDGQKLSKRHGAVSVMQYEELGYLPEALVNFLAHLGWGHGDDEIFSRQQFVSWFDLDAINPAPSRFDTDKLKWVNQEHMKRLSEVGARTAPRALSRARRARTRGGSTDGRGRRTAARPRGDARGNGGRGALFLHHAETCARQRSPNSSTTATARRSIEIAGGIRDRRVEARGDRHDDQGGGDEARAESRRR